MAKKKPKKKVKKRVKREIKLAVKGTFGEVLAMTFNKKI